MSINKYQDELFEKLNKAFAKDVKENTRKEILKLVPGNNYTVRLIPNMDDPSKTFKNYYMHGWISESDGKYISTGCPTTYSEECPICKEYFRLWNKSTEESLAQAKLIKRKSRLYANVFVVDDPINPENNNTVKILSYGQQLEKVITDAWSGDDKEEVGIRMFDFSETGCNLRIKVEKNQGGFPVYTASKFLNPSALTVTLEAIKDQIHDLDALVKIKPKNELEVMISEGLYGESVEANGGKPTTNPKASDDIPMTFKKPSEPSLPADVSVNETNDTDDDDVMASLQKYIKE